METLTKCVSVLRVNDSTELKTNRGFLTLERRPFISQLITRQLMPSQLTRKNYGLHPASFYQGITHHVVMELNNKLINAARFLLSLHFLLSVRCYVVFTWFYVFVLPNSLEPPNPPPPTSKTQSINRLVNLRKRHLLIWNLHKRHNFKIKRISSMYRENRTYVQISLKYLFTYYIYYDIQCGI